MHMHVTLHELGHNFGASHDSVVRIHKLMTHEGGVTHSLVGFRFALLSEAYGNRTNVTKKEKGYPQVIRLVA